MEHNFPGAKHRHKEPYHLSAQHNMKDFSALYVGMGKGLVRPATQILAGKLIGGLVTVSHRIGKGNKIPYENCF